MISADITPTLQAYFLANEVYVTLFAIFDFITEEDWRE